MWDVDTLTTPAIYHRGTLFFTELIEPAATPHWFGGELALTVDGLPKVQRVIHRVVTLDLSDVRLGLASVANLRHLPLLRCSGSETDYLVESDSLIRIKRTDCATPPEEWPYDALPRFGLRLLEPMRVSLEDMQPLTPQGFALSDQDELVVIVPSTRDYGGVSLWGELGWGVQLFFYFTPSDRRVWVANQID